MKKPALSSLTPDQYEARLKKILLAALGKAWMHWPPRAEVKRRCAIKERSGWFRCEICQQEREKIEVDHISPCIKPSEGFTTWDAYINSRFVLDAKKLQGLCHECHKAKSKSENVERRKKREHKG
jgi:hypothetical protein